MKKNILYLSLGLNFLLICTLFIIGFFYKEKIFDLIGFKPQKNIVMFGDSLVAHGDWSEVLGRDDVKNSGLSGYTTKKLLKKLEDKVLKHKPKICFLEGGINDMHSLTSLDSTKENIIAIVEILKRNDIKVVLHSVVHTSHFEHNKRVDSLNVIYKDIARTHNIPFIDLNSKFSKNNVIIEDLSTDGLHLEKKAYPMWASLIKSYLTL